MNILMLTPWYPDKIHPTSGAFIRSQAEAISSDHHVVVISSKVNYTRFSLCSYTVEESNYKGIREYRLMINRSLPVYNQINQLAIAIFFTLKITKGFKPDVIHSSIGYPGAFWGWVMSRLLKRKFVFTEHTRVINNFRSFFHKQLTLFALRRTENCIAVSSVLATEIEAYTNKKVTVIPNVVEVERFETVTADLPAEVHIGFLGGMNTPVKGLDLLLRALASLNGSYTFHIGGSGTLEAEYKTLARSLGIMEKCRFYGFIQYDQVPSFMQQLSFLVCSSRYETFNVSLVEAMATGLPVVSTRCGGPEDFVDEKNGILVDVNQPEKLAAGIAWMMANYRSFDRQRIKEYARNNFSAACYRDRINKIYRSSN